jgi:signal peptidase II
MRILFPIAIVALLLSLLAGFVAEYCLTQPVWLIDRQTGLLLSHNPGIAFGIHLPSPLQEIIILLALAAVTVVALRSKDRLPLAAFGLIIGGAVANLIDRFIDGVVTDFVRVGTFPVFNLADSCITIGAVLLIGEALFLAVQSRQKGSGTHRKG